MQLILKIPGCGRSTIHISDCHLVSIQHRHFSDRLTELSPALNVVAFPKNLSTTPGNSLIVSVNHVETPLDLSDDCSADGSSH
jgi:hypothetical protein